VNRPTDQQLLRDYAGHRSEPAFTELVQRHVDLVYSAALRMLRDAQLAEDVTQGVFAALAQNAPQLVNHPVLSGWLHRTAQNLAAKIIRTDARRRAREQEAVAMTEMLSTESDTHWEQIAPHLDAALGELSEQERDALLLRYFERKSAREMAETLGVSNEAAQKRVSRAVDRLREVFAKRGVTVGAGGLAAVLTANAVQAAPAGMAVAISTTAALAGTTVAASTITTVTKAIAMTTMQKLLVVTTLTVVAGAGIYQARQASLLNDRVQLLQHEQAPLADQIQQLQRERDDATNRLASLLANGGQLNSNAGSAELLKLRGEVTQLREQLAQSQGAAGNASDPFTQSLLALGARAAELNRYLERMPDKKIPELQVLAESDWLNAAVDAKLDTDANIRKSLGKLRSLAKSRIPMGRSLNAFITANNGQLPTDLSQLKSYFKSALGAAALDDSTIDAIFGRYTLLHGGNLSDYPSGTWFIGETAPVDEDYDSRAKFGNGSSTTISTGIGEAGDPEDPSY
jgi:RNA polymerase sigma factor (sigma-70 family)